MKRRNFIAATASAGAVAALGTSLIQSCTSPDPVAGPESFELNEVTLQQLQEGMRNGKYTAVNLVKQYLRRIREIDQNGPKLNSVIELNPDAETIAVSLDRERKEGKIRGPLHGIPVLIKDNIDTADRMSTTAGSLALEGSHPLQDAFIIKRLREAGAVILGKTNLSEWANYRSTRSTSGWSGRGGQTLNPWVLDRNPCGSSSGSGVAVSANLCAAAIGTETDGSIVCPATINGIVGLKPTLGLWSRSGIIPLAHSQDTAGPMTRTVSDAAVMLGLLTGPDDRDPVTGESSGKVSADYTRFLDANGLQGARIGVARNFFGFHEKVDVLMEDAIRLMASKGALIIDNADITNMREIEENESVVLQYEFRADINRYLSSLPDSVKMRSLKDLIAFNEANREKEMPWFGQELFLMAEEGQLTGKQYLDALAAMKLAAGKNGIDAVMEKHQLDALIAPTGGPAWTTDPVNGDHYSGGSSTPAACAGYPAITVPAGFVHGLPVGITFIGTAWTEPVLIRLAFAYEQASGHRKMPGFLPRLG